jgi:hypothetical protein
VFSAEVFLDASICGNLPPSSTVAWPLQLRFKLTKKSN